MLLMIQNKVNRSVAETFIRQMQLQDFTPVDVQGHVHFTFNGKTSINYSVYLNPHDGRACYIGIRPVVEPEDNSDLEAFDEAEAYSRAHTAD